MSDWKIALLIWNQRILLKETGTFLLSLELRKDMLIKCLINLLCNTGIGLPWWLWYSLTMDRFIGNSPIKRLNLFLQLLNLG